MWKQGEGYVYQSEGNRTFYYETEKHNKTTSTQKNSEEERKGLWVVFKKPQRDSRSAAGRTTHTHTHTQGKGYEV